MGDQLSTAGKPIANANNRTSVVISPWVNEPFPPIQNLLSSHDVARLTRRPSWLISSLSFIGRFPKKAKFQGRAMGWRQSEVLDWMARDLSVTERTTVPRVCPRRDARQACLPLKCAAPRTPEPGCSNARTRKPKLRAGARP